MSDKIIYDVIHGYVKISPLCLKIIDTPEFQRLRNLKQLGLTYLIFTSANHTRFEHSIGVSFLAGEMLKHLKYKQPELEITDREIELIKIAGLCHDLGHGPFSHFFDNFVLNIIDSQMEHEVRSCLILELIIKKYGIEISELEKHIIFNMILPDEECLSKERSFLYKIVNNKKNGIDVDKFDYIKRDSFFLGMSFGFDCSRIIKQSRVIDGDICFLDKTFYDIQELYEVRDKLHRRVYKHHTNTCLDYMMLDVFKDVFKDLSKKMDFKEIVENPEEFWKLDDNFIWKYEHQLLDNIKRRKLYKHIKDIDESNLKNEIDGILNDAGDNLVLYELKFGYKSEIFDEIYFYNLKEIDNKFKKTFNKLNRMCFIRVITRYF
jgi:deoxynucleoside triphosphate triphosphohydrolase SAMHD1